MWPILKVLEVVAREEVVVCGEGIRNCSKAGRAS